MIMKRALPPLALLLGADAAADPVLAETRECPACPLPPQVLLKPSARTNFLDRTY